MSKLKVFLGALGLTLSSVALSANPPPVIPQNACARVHPGVPFLPEDLQEHHLPDPLRRRVRGLSGPGVHDRVGSGCPGWPERSGQPSGQKRESQRQSRSPKPQMRTSVGISAGSVRLMPGVFDDLGNLPECVFLVRIPIQADRLHGLQHPG